MYTMHQGSYNAHTGKGCPTTATSLYFNGHINCNSHLAKRPPGGTAAPSPPLPSWRLEGSEMEGAAQHRIHLVIVNLTLS